MTSTIYDQSMLPVAERDTTPPIRPDTGLPITTRSPDDFPTPAPEFPIDPSMEDQYVRMDRFYVSAR